VCTLLHALPKSRMEPAFFGARRSGFCRKRGSRAPTLLQQLLEGCVSAFWPARERPWRGSRAASLASAPNRGSPRRATLGNKAQY
jgi:hypothetical protein